MNNNHNKRATLYSILRRILYGGVLMFISLFCISGTVVKSGFSSYGIQANEINKIYLKRNLINGVNTLTQSMINQKNTIYVIQHKFFIDEIINVPEGCILEFDGGCLMGGTIIGNGTAIKSGIGQIFDGVSIAGDWSVNEAYPEWFGAKGDGVADDTKAINASLFFKKVVIQNKTYLISSPIILNEGNILCSNSAKFEVIDSSESINNLPVIKAASDLISLILLNGSHISIEGLLLYGNNMANYGVCSALENISRINLSRLFVIYTKVSGYNLSCYLSKLELCIAKYSTTGFKLGGAKGNTSIVCSNCMALRCDVGFVIKNLTYSTFMSCAADNNNTAYHISDVFGVSILYCGSEKCMVGCKLDYKLSGVNIDGFCCTPSNNGKVIEIKPSANGDIRIINLVVDGGMINSIESIVEGSKSGVKIKCDDSVNALGCSGIIISDSPNIFSELFYSPSPNNSDSIKIKKIQKGLFGVESCLIQSKYVAEFCSITLAPGTYVYSPFNNTTCQNDIFAYVSKQPYSNDCIIDPFAEGCRSFVLADTTTVHFGIENKPGVKFSNLLLSPYLIKL